MMKLKPGETVVFSYLVFESRAHRDRVNAKVMKEMEKMEDVKELPFDMKRMVYGGFEVLVEVQRGAFFRIIRLERIVDELVLKRKKTT